MKLAKLQIETLAWPNRKRHLYWESLENRKSFLEEIKRRLNIVHPSKWGKITVHQIYNLGGGTMLSKFYKNSIFNCLQSIYPETQWKKDWFSNIPQYPKSYWEAIENRRKFMNQVTLQLNIKRPEDWGKVTVHQVMELGGHSLLNKYNGSLFHCLQSLYNEVEWKREWFLKLSRVRNSHWKSIENRRKLMDEIAIKLNIKEPKDWGQVTNHQIQKMGGGSILNGSLVRLSIFQCLQSIYPEIEWKREWFPKVQHFKWKTIQDRRKFMGDIALKLDIKKPSDWGAVSVDQIRELGGHLLIKSYYQGSLFQCLQSLYPDIEWDKEWFHKIPAHLQSFEDHKKFLDGVASTLNVRNPRDWGKVTIKHIKCLKRGHSMLRHYNHSLFVCLRTIYKGIAWKREWFPNVPRFSKSHWNSVENCRKFMDQIARVTNISELSDWRKVTLSAIIKKGGKSLLEKYGGTLYSTLRSLYPLSNWEETQLWERNASTEVHFQRLIGQVFPNENLIFNSRDSNRILSLVS